MEKPKEIIIDAVRGKYMESSIRKESKLANADDVAAAKAKSVAAMQRFHRQLQNSMPRSATQIPEEANDVDTVDRNITRHIEAVFGEESLTESLRKEMISAAQREQKQDEANMNDFQVQAKAKAASKKNTSDQDALPKRLAALDALIIERCGKLEASCLHLFHEFSSAKDPDLSYISDEQVLEQQKEAFTSAKEKARIALDEYKKKVSEFIVGNKDPSKKLRERHGDDIGIENVDAFVKEIADTYRAYFGKGDILEPYRKAMREWKKDLTGAKRVAEKHEAAVMNRSAKKRKVAPDEPQEEEEEDSPLVAKLRLAGLSAIANVNVVETPSELADEAPFAKVLCQPTLLEAEAAELAALSQMKTMCSWADKKLKAEGADPVVTTVVANKKMLSEIKKAVGGKVDSSLAHGTFKLTFPATHEETKKAVVNYQITRTVPYHSGINVTSFCFGEVRLQLVGTYALFGMRVSELPGGGYTEKNKRLHDLSVDAFKEAVNQYGFSILVKKGSLIYIPPGYTVLSISDGGTLADVLVPDEHPTHLRWSVYHDSHAKVVQETINELLQQFPWLKDTEYYTLFDLLSPEVAQAGMP